MTLRMFARVLAVVFVLTAASCGGSNSASGGDVFATLKDFSLTAEPATFASADITLSIDNQGPSVHEFVIIRSDTDAGQLRSRTDSSLKIKSTSWMRPKTSPRERTRH